MVRRSLLLLPLSFLFLSCRSNLDKANLDKTWELHIHPKIQHDLFVLAHDSLKISDDNLYKAAFEWSNDIKFKILHDVDQKPDKVENKIEANDYLTVNYYCKGVKTICFRIHKKTNDTLNSQYFGRNQMFAIVRELCPGIEPGFEGIKYIANNHDIFRQYGIAEFKFCDGKLKEQGFRYGKNDIGIWKEWDKNGNLVKTVDEGNSEKLKDMIAGKFDQ